jgi:hypothetical protein
MLLLPRLERILVSFSLRVSFSHLTSLFACLEMLGGGRGWCVKVSLGKVELIEKILATKSNKFSKFNIKILHLEMSVTKIYDKYH